MRIYFISNDRKEKPSAFEAEVHKYKMSSSYFTMMYDENFINNIMQWRVQKEKCSDSAYNSQTKYYYSLWKQQPSHRAPYCLKHICHMTDVVTLDTNGAHLEEISERTRCWTSKKGFFGLLCEKTVSPSNLNSAKCNLDSPSAVV